MASPMHIVNKKHIACLKLVLDKGYTVKEAAKEIGVNVNTLYSRVGAVRSGKATYEGQPSKKAIPHPVLLKADPVDVPKPDSKKDSELEQENDALRYRCLMQRSEIETLWRALQMANAERFCCEDEAFDDDDEE